MVWGQEVLTARARPLHRRPAPSPMPSPDDDASVPQPLSAASSKRNATSTRKPSNCLRITIKSCDSGIGPASLRPTEGSVNENRLKG